MTDTVDQTSKAKVLLDALKYLQRHYVGQLENARDRIVWLGGQCDSVETMERGDPHLRQVREVIASVEATPDETFVQRIGPTEPDNDMVICPQCTSQFVAIPVNVQRRLSSPQSLPCECTTYCIHSGYPDAPLCRGYFCREKVNAQKASDVPAKEPGAYVAPVCAVCEGVFIDHRHGAMGHDWQPKPQSEGDQHG